MDIATFKQQLSESGYDDIAEKHGEAHARTSPHAHPFAVRGLVIEGEFILTQNGTAQPFLPGETFSLEANCEHSEASGAHGSVYLVGRKHSR